MSAEPDYLPADALAEDEPKYLRRQKPVEIRKRKFSRKAWPLYRRILVGGIAALWRDSRCTKPRPTCYIPPALRW